MSAWTKLAEDAAVAAQADPSDLQSIIVDKYDWGVIVNKQWYTAIQTQYQELLQEEVDAQQK